MNEEVNVTFIIPKDCRNENECSEDMQLAFVAAEQHSGGGIQSKWVHESLLKSFEDITKRDVFVLSEFEGELFEKLRKTKCLVVGPRCLACCLTEGTAIPSGPEPVYTVAMRDLMVTASGLTKEKKELIKKKVHWMGGIYNTAMTVDTTHLISDTVLSEKYIKSVEKGVPVMSESWVEAVWEASLRLNINGSSADFDAHRLPAFAHLQVTTSGISKRDKQIIMKLVNENGGTFSGAFQSETTDVVVLTKEGIGSEKYKAALEYGKACVLPAWVKDSAAKGVALPVTRYKITGASTSSPLTEHRLPDMSLNFSRITNSRPPSNFVDETRSTDISTMSTKMKFSQESKKSNDSMDKDVQMAFDNFDMTLIKKAGPIFDGFCIWVCGVEGVYRERCAACVSRCGGVRYDAAAARVTHAVAGTLAGALAAARALPAVPVLSPLWLLRSVEAGRALDEADFVLDVKPKTPMKSCARKLQTDAASPMSKRNLQLLRREPLDLPPPGPAPAPPDQLDIEPHEDLVNHYLSQNVQQNLNTPTKRISEEPVPPPAQETTFRQEQPDVTEDLGDEPTEEMEQIFRGIKIEVQGLDDEAIIEIGAEIAAAGGVLAAGGAGGSHVLVPLDFDPEELITKHAEPVTVFWVKDCLSQQELVDIQYYHRPVQVPQWRSEPPLRGVVASLSTYSGVERAFLDELAKLLGATTQLRFCRRNTTNAIASTHLICPTASGDKYVGALKWGLPAVKASWLLECLKQGKRVSEKEHLVGDTKAPPLQDDIEEEVEPVEQDNEQTNKATDKENAMLPPGDTNVPRRGSMIGIEKTTPIGKHLSDGDEMSPASRYIAMARQGLLGGDSQETPKRLNQLKNDDKQGGEGFSTPPIEDALSSPNLMGFSPRTRRRLQAVRRGEMPSGPIRTPTDPFERNVSTPDSDFGCGLAPASGRLSPEFRKRLWRLVDGLPSKQPDPVRDKHTPLSEIRNRFLADYGGETSTGHGAAPRKLQLPDSPDTPPAKMPKLSDKRAGISGNVTYEEQREKTTSSAPSEAGSLVDVQLQRLDEALAGRFSSQRQRRLTRDSLSVVPPPQPVQDAEFGPESQPNTVGWDDTTPAPPVPDPTPTSYIKRFMLSSNVDNREEVIEMIHHLGGEVSEGAELDPEATHLLCAVPGRSEKMLGSIAAGRWVLHPAYIARSRQANKFLPEEEFEWGNPLATCLPGVAGGERVLARAAYRWRSGRERGAPGAFAGVVALLHVPPPRRRLLARLVTAGGGVAPDDEPPYANETVTVCFADIKRYPLSSRDAQWLMSRRIPVCAPVLLSSYLTDDEPPRPEQHCLPEYRTVSS